ncbi:recombinase RecT [Aquisphaera giovannonii]|nr:recombinase RecT [Aquisphaera giovannonii]
MTEDLTTQTKPTSRQQLVVQRKNDIQLMENELKKMLPQSLPSDKFVRTVQTAITLNPDIAEAEKNSVLNACMKAAADGLVLDGREAALTIFNTKVKKNGQDTWVKMAQYIPMVAGIIKRVRNSGEVSRLNAFVVYKNDVFRVTYGLEMTLEHVPNFSDPGEAIGAYAVCRFKDGEVDFEFMSTKQIEGIRERSKSKDKGPWQTDWSEMARKTVIRRLAKRLPVDSDIARVVQHIDEDYDFQPSGQAVTPHDEDGVVLENQENAKPAKARGSAAAKLNPKPKQPEPGPVIENEPQDHEAGDASSNPPGDTDEPEDII